MSDQNQSPDEKEWSEIRNEIMKKLELFTDRQIERVKASIHKHTAPRSESDMSEEEKTHSAEIDKLDYEGGRSSEKQIHPSDKHSHSDRKHKKKSA